MVAISLLRTLWLRTALAARDGTLTDKIDVEPRVLGSLAGVESSSSVRDDFHMMLTDISFLISWVASNIHLTAAGSNTPSQLSVLRRPSVMCSALSELNPRRSSNSRTSPSAPGSLDRHFPPPP